MSTQLQYAITLIKSGDTQQGRQLLVELLKAEPKNELAWLWMSNVVSTDEQRRHCLKQVLSINPHHSLAQKGLAILQQKSLGEPIGSPRQAVSPALKSQVTVQPDSKGELSQPLTSPLQSATTASLTATGSSPGLADELTGAAKSHLPSLAPTPPVISPVMVSPLAEKRQPAKVLKPPEHQPAITSAAAAPVIENKRVWIHPKSSLHRLVILYDNGIAVVANPDKATLLQLAVSQDLPAREVFGRNLSWIPIHEITTVEAVPGADSVYIRSAPHNRATLQRIPLANTKALEEFMNAFQTKWGTGFERTLKPYSMFAAMIIPLIAFGVIILLTYFLHGAAVEVATGDSPEIRGRRVLLQYLVLGLITMLGPTGVLVVGILLAALTLFWMFASMLNPPTRTILTPLKNPASPPPSPSVTPTAPTLQPLAPKAQAEPAAPPQALKAPAEPAPKPAQVKVTAPDKPKKQGTGAFLIRSLLIVFIFIALACAGFLYLNLPPSSPYPGLIEGGTAIDLSNRHLTDADLRALAIHTYPQEGLVTLDLSGNLITELPPEIGQITNLQYLYIKDTPLQTLPPEIGQLTNLRLLNLQDSRLTRLPPEVGQLYYLEALDLQGNKLRALPLEISRLPNLRMLNIQRTMIQRLPPEFEQKPNLEILYWYLPFE